MAERRWRGLNRDETVMYEQVRAFYLSKGFGGRVGFGSSPAIIIIDMAKAWLDESSPLGSRNVQGVLAPILRILEIGRERRAPVIFTTMASAARGGGPHSPLRPKAPHTPAGHAVQRGRP